MPPGSDRIDRSRSAADRAVGDENSDAWGVLVAVSERAKLRDRPDIMLWRSEHALGRNVDDKEFVFTEPGISGLHCTIFRRRADGEEGFATYIKDTSLNGTHVNGEKLVKNVERVLKDGDLVSLLYVSSIHSYVYRDRGSAKRKASAGENDENKRPKIEEKGVEIRDLQTAEEYKTKLEEDLRQNAALTEMLEKKLQEEKEKWNEERRREMEAQQKDFDDRLENARNENRMEITTLKDSLGNEREGRIESEHKTAELTKAIYKEKGISDYLNEELRKIRRRIDEILEHAARKASVDDDSVDAQLNERGALREIRVNASQEFDLGRMRRNKGEMEPENLAGPSRYRGSSGGDDSSALPARGAVGDALGYTALEAANDVPEAPLAEANISEANLMTSESMPYVSEDSDERRNRLGNVAAPITSADLLANESLPETSNHEEANAGNNGGRGDVNLAPVASAAGQLARRDRRKNSSMRSDARSPLPGDGIVGPMEAEQQGQGQGQGEEAALVEGPRLLQAGAGVLAAAAAAQAEHGSSQVGNSDTQPGGLHPAEDLLGHSQTQQFEDFPQFGPAFPQRPPRVPVVAQALHDEAGAIHRMTFDGQEILR